MIGVSELVEGLRATAEDHHDRVGHHGLAGQCREAANALEALARENAAQAEELRIINAKLDQCWGARNDAESQLAAMALVVEAARRIANPWAERQCDDPTTIIHLANIARQALANLEAANV